MPFHINTFSIVVGLVFSHDENQVRNFTTPEHCSLPLRRLLCYQYTLQDKISDTQASPGIARGDKDTDLVSGSFSVFQGSWWRQDEKLLIFATSSQLCTGWISATGGLFLPKSKDTNCTVKPSLKGSKEHSHTVILWQRQTCERRDWSIQDAWILVPRYTSTGNYTTVSLSLSFFLQSTCY